MSANQLPPGVETAVLNERMNRVLLLADNLVESIKQIHDRLGEIPMVQRDIANLDEKTEKLMEAIAAVQDVTRNHGMALGGLSFVWKAFSGAAIAACFGIITFSYNTLDKINEKAEDINRRITVVEYRIQAVSNGEKAKN